MNQSRRNKKNENYSKHLIERYGLTKSDEWKRWSNNVIERGKPKTLKREFVLTKRNGRIVTKEIYVFEWTTIAKKAQKNYHATKNGIKLLPRKPIEKKKQLTKAEKLEERNFSLYHKLLINSLYGSNRMERIMKQQAFIAAHEEKIRRIIDTKRKKNLSLEGRIKEQNDENAVLIA